MGRFLSVSGMIYLCLAGFFLFSFAWAQADGLVLEYLLDEGSGTVASDSSVYGNDGTINGATWVEGEYGMALEFDGLSDYLDCGSDASLENESAGTIELMFYPNTYYQGGLITRSTGINWEDQRLVLAFNTSGSAKLEFILADGTPGNYQRVDIGLPALNVWTHLAVVWDGTLIKIYKDGILIKTEGQLVIPEVTGVPLKVGYCEGLGAQYFRGTIDEVRVYNQALGPEEIGHKNRLNNLVTEYINTAPGIPGMDYLVVPFKEYKVNHHRDGWVFLSAAVAGNGGDLVYITIDSGDYNNAVIQTVGGTTEPEEAIAYVSKGGHEVKVFTQGTPDIQSLIVRSIPMTLITELSFATYGQPDFNDPNLIYRHRIYDWDFYQTYVNPNASVLNSDREDQSGQWQPYATEWHGLGRKWGFARSIDHSLLDAPDPVQAFYDDWRQTFDQVSYVDGLTLDEMLYGSENITKDAYNIWAGALDLVALNYPDKEMWPYSQLTACDSDKYAAFQPLLESVQTNGYRWLGEAYFMLAGSSDEAAQAAFIQSWAGNKVQNFRNRLPGFVENNLVHVFGMFNYHYNLGLTPDLDYRVFLDMQFHHVANYSSYQNLYGVTLYTTRSTTEEMIVYASSLLRHYGIEGNKGRYNTDPLGLSYLNNPGFEQDEAYWTVTEASPGSVYPLLVTGLPYQKVGSTTQVMPSESKVLCTVRSASAPNELSQTITGLTLGRLYSLTVWVLDLTDFGTFKIAPISIELSNVREIASKAEDNEVYTGDFTNINRGCTNYHFRVFRALGTEATLTLSDWGSPDAPGGAVGNQIIWDYIKVQPYWVPVAAEVVPLGEGWTLFSTGEPNPVSWDSFQVSDGTDTYNVLDANASSWIEQTIYYFDAASQQYKLTPTDNEYLYYYHGYWIWSKRSGLELIY